jgi:hypothetical protein
VGFRHFIVRSVAPAAELNRFSTMMTPPMKRILTRAAVCLLWVACVNAVVESEELGQTFNGQRYDLKKFRPTGANTAKSIQPETQGLRIRLPANRPNTLPVGLIARSGIRGDFEITLSFEVLKVDRPTQGHGAGISIWITLPTPTRDAATLAWLFNPDGERFLVANRAANAASGEREYHGATPVPTNISFGRLRLARKDATLTYAVAEGASRDFQEIYQTEWSSADVETIRFAADTGGSPTSVDVRLREIAIHAADLGSARVVATAKSPWQFRLVIVAIFSVLAGAIYWFRRRRLAAY